MNVSAEEVTVSASHDDLLIKIVCSVTKINNIFILKTKSSKLGSTRRSTALILPLQ
jgi:hypothetical protein